MDDANECTETTGPPLLINVPNWANINAILSRIIFQIWNIPLLFWTIIEWMKAVRANQGIRATFSIGSQLQYPPQPSIV